MSFLALAGCSSLDSDQARICRTALPALDADAQRIEVARVAPGPEPGSVRIDYRASAGGRPALPRFAVCRFGGDGLAAGRTELVAVTTDRGPVSPAAIYLLRRYYLDGPEAAVADPGPGDANAGLPELPQAVAYAAQQLLVGLPRCGVYGLLAAGYALVFGLVGRINLAFGEIAAIGAAAAGIGTAAIAAADFTALLAGVGIGLVAAVYAAALHGAVAGRVSFGLVPASRTQASLIATVGLSIALLEYLRLAGGTVPAWIPPVWTEPWRLGRAGDFILTLTPVSLATSGVGVAASLALLGLMSWSRYGREWRALRDDRVAAALFGLDAHRITLLTFGVAGALAGLAGALVAIQYGALGFAGGFQLGLKALAASVLGGIGSVPGALVGGLAIGTFETLWSAYLPIEGRDLALYAVLVVTIALRPEGLFGSVTPRVRT